MQGAECCDKAAESFSVSAALLRLLASFRSSFWFCRTFPPQYSGRLLTSIVISYESVIRVRKKIKSPQQIAPCHITGLHLCFTLQNQEVGNSGFQNPNQSNQTAVITNSVKASKAGCRRGPAANHCWVLFWISGTFSRKRNICDFTALKVTSKDQCTIFSMIIFAVAMLVFWIYTWWVRSWSDWETEQHWLLIGYQVVIVKS